jgi:hypothetical protein
VNTLRRSPWGPAWATGFLVVAAVLSSPAAAQQANLPRAGYVFPAGGKAGTTVKVTLGGQYLNGVSGVRLSGKGVSAGELEYVRPPNPGQVADLRDKARELEAWRAAATRSAATTRPWGEAQEKELEALRTRLLAFVNRASIPALQETVSVDLTIAPDAEPGPREIRLVTPAGMTVPLKFVVGRLDEFTEPDAARVSVRTEGVVGTPCVVNGRILGGDVDRVRFAGKKGERVVVRMEARALVPYISDAVPGWFQGVVRLTGPDGRELAYSEDFRDAPDPVLVLTLPADGEYVVELRDALFRGREDFVYRLTVGQIPLVTSAFPLGVRAGAGTVVELRGANLVSPTTRPVANEPGLTEIAWAWRNTRIGPVPLDVEDLPELSATAAGAELIPPVVVNGRLASAGARAVFTFPATQGQALVAEVIARRAGSPLDSVLTLTDDAGNVIASNDDCPDLGRGLMTHHADARLMFTVPKSGLHRLTLADVRGHGGPEFAYRLRVSAPRPDFELRTVPSAVHLRSGVPTVVRVCAIRRDGYAGPITLSCEDPAITIHGGTIPAGADSVRVTLLTGEGEGVRPLVIVGRGAGVARRSVPADDWQQAFSYRHLVGADEGLAVVTGRASRNLAPEPTTTAPTLLVAGGQAMMRLKLSGRSRFGGLAWDAPGLEFRLSDAPAGVELTRWSVKDGVLELDLRAGTGAKPWAGNLIVEALAGKENRRAVGVLPALPVVVMEAKSGEASGL